MKTYRICFTDDSPYHLPFSLTMRMDPFQGSEWTCAAPVRDEDAKEMQFPRTGTYSANIGQDLYELRKYSYLREYHGEYMWEGILCHKWLLMGIDYSSKEPRFKYVCKLTGLERYELMEGTLVSEQDRPALLERVPGSQRRVAL
jgi:hypothetical protein